MKVRNKILYSVLCAMLFVMSFTTVTAFADTLESINGNYLGTYQNPNNSNSRIIIKEPDSITSAITALVVYDSQRHIWFNGASSVVEITNRDFSSSFAKVREVNEQGVIQGDDNYWVNGVELQGKVASDVIWFKKYITITTLPDFTKYTKS